MVRSKQRVLRLLAVLLALALIAAACGGDSDDDAVDEPIEATGETQEDPDESESEDPPPDDGGATEETIEVSGEDPVQGGVLRYGLEADVDGLNPTASALSSPGVMMAGAVFDTLAAWDENGNAVPFLAESFTPNEDASSWTVKLRPDIKFHDGTDLTIDAVIGAFETQINDPLVGLAVKPFYPDEGAVERIDDLTAQFNLLEPNQYWPAALTAQLGFVPSPTWVALALEDPTLDQQPVGTGPFVFAGRDEDSVTRFERNDDYWGEPAYLDAVEFVPVTDPDTRADLLIQGELNAQQTTDQANIDLLTNTDGINNILDDTGDESFAMINSASPPFDDIRARQALTFASPLQTYADLIGLGVTRRANGPFNPESPYYNPDVVQEGDDPDAAVALAAEYCAERGEDTNAVLGTSACTDGKINIELQWSGPSVVQTRIAEILDEGWSVAFNVTFNELPQDQHIQETAFGLYNVNTWRQFGAIDPANDNVWLLCRTIGGISLNWPKFCDEDRDTVLLAAQATTDPAERATLYQELSQKLSDDYLYIFFNHTMWDNAFADNVKDVCNRVSPDGVPLRCNDSGRTFFNSVWIAE